MLGLLSLGNAYIYIVVNPIKFLLFSLFALILILLPAVYVQDCVTVLQIFETDNKH
jgi:hypothetical protein